MPRERTEQRGREKDFSVPYASSAFCSHGYLFYNSEWQYVNNFIINVKYS